MALSTYITIRVIPEEGDKRRTMTRFLHRHGTYKEPEPVRGVTYKITPVNTLTHSGTIQQRASKYSVLITVKSNRNLIYIF
jgi:hypothetical protein